MSTITKYPRSKLFRSYEISILAKQKSYPRSRLFHEHEQKSGLSQPETIWPYICVSNLSTFSEQVQSVAYSKYLEDFEYSQYLEELEYKEYMTDVAYKEYITEFESKIESIESVDSESESEINSVESVDSESEINSVESVESESKSDYVDSDFKYTDNIKNTELFFGKAPLNWGDDE
jgi:hypothetical protein